MIQIVKRKSPKEMHTLNNSFGLWEIDENLSNTEEMVTVDAPKVSVSQCVVMEEVIYTILPEYVHDQISKEYQNVQNGKFC